MADKDDFGKPVNKGPERRKLSRRQIAERRNEIRWEPDKPNRRESKGRRAVDQLEDWAKKI